jgi:nucleoside-diphosphate-sugar epimerase
MRFLILGGTRFIGPAVVRLLVEQGQAVAVFHRGESRADLPSSVVHLLGDRKCLAGFATDFARFGPDVLIDMFAMTEMDAVAVVKAFGGLVRRMVVLSSMDVYRAYDRFRGIDPGAIDTMPLAEDAPLRNELFPYRSPATSADELLFNYEKILVERAVLGQPGLPATVVRLPCVYGPGDYQHRTFEYLKRMDDGRPAILLSEHRAAWRWTRGYVENVAAAVVLAATDDRASGQIFNVGDEESLSEADWVRRIGHAAAWQGEVLTVPENELPDHLRTTVNWRQDIVGDTGKIRRELGYRERVPALEAMARTVAWERIHTPEHIDPKQYDYGAEEVHREWSRARVVP